MIGKPRNDRPGWRKRADAELANESPKYIEWLCAAQQGAPEGMTECFDETAVAVRCRR